MKIVFRNQNIDPSAYRQFVDMPRPGHADWVRRIKYGADSLTSGGGMFSGRMTLPLVAAGVVARKIIAPVTVSARLTEVGGQLVNGLDDPVLEAVLTEAAEEGDSVGGIIECVCSGVPAGLGDPFFYPMEAALSQMIFSKRQPVGLPRGRKAHVQHCPSPADRQSLHGPHGGAEYKGPSRRMLRPARPSRHRERRRHRPLRFSPVYWNLGVRKWQ